MADHTITNQDKKYRFTDNKGNVFILDQTEYETLRIMVKILNLPAKTILSNVKLFSKIEPEIKQFLDKISRINKEDYATALMLLEYILYSKDISLEDLTNNNSD